MKALAYFKANTLQNFAIQEMDVAAPHLKETDLLIRVKAISVNPVDYKIRQSRNAENNHPVILGWDAAGVVEKKGAKVQGFNIGDEVYYAGDLMRDGAYAELEAVDYRIVSLKPKNLSFAEAAALPLTALTAYEALFPRAIFDTQKETKVLIIGGAGGVGSIATQIVKAFTKSIVITTASRPETIAWVHKMGADFVIDHSQDIQKELVRIGINEVDVVFGTTHSTHYLQIIPEILKPFGHFCLIDDPKQLDIVSFKRKAISVHWEFMFAKTLFGYDLSSQGEILKQISKLVEENKIISTANVFLKGFSAANIKKAHELLESSQSIGKIVVEF